MKTQEFNTDRIRLASPLELPNVIMETELHDQKTAFEVFEEASRSLSGEGIEENILIPVMSTIVDGILTLKVFQGVSAKLV